ncbi:MAG: hypothetical protein CL927_09480 [Deltaproteobacteria bacterium]|nr:hypothetical protein [Deltaproteobacteria bacterium]HCH63013.1 hypothetical protein [Deltaproteobacteria bacterium]
MTHPPPPNPPPQRLPAALRQAILDASTLGASLFGHLLVAAVIFGFGVVTVDLDTPGDDNGATEGPVGNDGGDAGGEQTLQTPPVPVRISVYQPGAPKPEETNEPKPRKTQPSAQPTPETTSTTATEPTPEGDGKAKTEGVAGKAPRGNKKPCEPAEEITKVSEHKWKVERSILDWYAVHLRELEKQAGVGIHRGKDGKRDGARLYLPRCSVLRQAGFRGGDVIHTVNGHKVTSIANGVKTYAKVRNDRVLKVDLTRKNGKSLTLTYKLVH